MSDSIPIDDGLREYNQKLRDHEKHNLLQA